MCPMFFCWFKCNSMFWGGLTRYSLFLSSVSRIYTTNRTHHGQGSPGSTDWDGIAQIPWYSYCHFPFTTVYPGRLCILPTLPPSQKSIYINYPEFFCTSSVQFSHSVVSDSLWPHGLLYTRSPCPSPTPGVHPNPCPVSQWCHPTVSSSVFSFSSHFQSLPASGSFQMSQFFTSGGQSIGVSALASILPMIIQDWFPLVGSPCSPRDGAQESSSICQFKRINSLALGFPYSPNLTSIHDYWKNHSFD